MTEKNSQTSQTSQTKKRKSHKTTIARESITRESTSIPTTLTYATNNSRDKLIKITFKHNVRQKKRDHNQFENIEKNEENNQNFSLSKQTISDI